MKRFLIITADDFGLHESVNEAVETGSRRGILTAASLMVSGRAVEDAILRARRTPQLRVGLHVVLADGWATLPAERVRALADSRGHMDAGMLLKGMRMFALPRVRRQLEAEIRAQFEAFVRTGLRLDHVDVHKHFHLHPTVLEILLRVGRDYGMSAVRVPDEPLWLSVRGGEWLSAISGALLAPSIVLMKRRLRAAHMVHNDHVFGLSASGSLNENKMLAIIASLPPGVTEIYLHPATMSGSVISPSMANYRHAEEFAGLVSSKVRMAISASRATLGGYDDLVRARGRHAA